MTYRKEEKTGHRCNGQKAIKKETKHKIKQQWLANSINDTNGEQSKNNADSSKRREN